MLYNVTESTLPKLNMVLQKVSQIGKYHLMSDNTWKQSIYFLIRLNTGVIVQCRNRTKEVMVK